MVMFVSFREIRSSETFIANGSDMHFDEQINVISTINGPSNSNGRTVGLIPSELYGTRLV